MSDKNTPQDPNLDFDKAKGMTIEEAMDKTSELEAGITEQDSVLDRYIKQHRDEVGSQKFVQRLSELDEIDTATLDEFIKKQREEIEKTGFLDKQSLVKATEELEQTEDLDSKLDKATVLQMDAIPVVPLASEQDVTTEETWTDSSWTDSTIYTGTETVNGKKSRKGLFLGGAALLIGAGALGLGWTFLNHQNQATKTTTETTTTTVSSASTQKAATQEDIAAFDTLYAGFFSDENKTQIKNSEFEKLSDLETALAKLEGTSSYKDAKSQYDGLKRQIEAIKAVNANFETDAIVDGQVQAAKVKADANFDSLSSDVLNTGSASLDSLIQSVISDGRSQLTQGTPAGSVSGATATTSGDSAATADQATAGSQDAGTGSVAAVDNSQAAAVTTTPVYASGVGITNYDPATLQRNLSRVAYNEANLADSTNPAWDFNPGILEKIVATSNQRGYFSGYNFIMERVAIVNGNGYYNIFKADGTYLFTLNAKTGYFVGNAPGNADNLDF